MRSSLYPTLALALAPATLFAQSANYALDADPARSSVDTAFSAELATAGTLIGDFNADTNPTGTQTRLGFFGGSGNQPVPLEAGVLIGSDIATTPAATAGLTVDNLAAPTTAELDGISIDLLNGAPASVDVALSFLYSTFRTVSPSFLYIGGFALEIPVASADVTALRLTQTAPATAALVPDGNGGYTLVTLLPAALDFEATSPFGPITLAAVPVTLPFTAALTLGDTATLTAALALDALATEVDLTALPALENQPFELPTLDPNVTAGVLLTVTPQSLALDFIGSIALTLTGDRTLIGCNPADYAEAFGTLDINDILVFANLFNAADPAADLFADAMFDINDVLTFAAAFNTGCP